MDNATWVKIDSWHWAIPGTDPIETQCGRTADAGALTVDLLPGGKSCESCLRSYAREHDLPEVSLDLEGAEPAIGDVVDEPATDVVAGGAEAAPAYDE